MDNPNNPQADNTNSISLNNDPELSEPQDDIVSSYNINSSAPINHNLTTAPNTNEAF